MICPNCGASNTDGAKFCGNCGVQLPIQQTGQNAPAANKVENYKKSYNYLQHQVTIPSGGPSNGGIIIPKNYMAEAIIVTVISFICCSSPISIILGIIAIIKANDVKSKFVANQFDIALHKAESAKKLTIWAAVIDAIWWIVCIIIILYGFAESFCESLFNSLSVN